MWYRSTPLPHSTPTDPMFKSDENLSHCVRVQVGSYVRAVGCCRDSGKCEGWMWMVNNICISAQATWSTFAQTSLKMLELRWANVWAWSDLGEEGGGGHLVWGGGRWMKLALSYTYIIHRKFGQNLTETGVKEWLFAHMGWRWTRST